MFARKYRLPAFIRFPRNTMIVTSDYVLKFRKNNLPYSRFGFIVRKALDKRSTHRNRIRRQIRSCVESLQDQILPGYDMLFLLKQGIMGKTRGELFDELRQTLEKHQLLKRDE